MRRFLEPEEASRNVYVGSAGHWRDSWCPQGGSEGSRAGSVQESYGLQRVYVVLEEVQGVLEEDHEVFEVVLGTMRTI